MGLTTGPQLGPYRITGPLGQGGMGEVDRATDTPLNRQVAVEVFPTEFAQHIERLAQFEREAVDMYELVGPFYPVVKGLKGNCTDKSGRTRPGAVA